MIVREEVRFTFYRVNKCGFYKHGAEEPEFGDLASILGQLRDWTTGIELSKTKLSEGDEELFPIYVLDTLQRGEDFVLACWNEVPSFESGVASVSATSKVGAPKIHMNEVVDGSIPGFPTYFWFMPARGLLATMKMGKRVGGQQEMRAYIERFMGMASNHVVRADEDADGELNIVGYQKDENSDVLNARPFFRTNLFVKPSHKKMFMDNRTKIKKVVRRGHFTATNKPSRTAWQHFVSFVRGDFDAGAANPVERRVYMELEYQPTVEELSTMIESEEKDEDKGVWDDMGFAFEGDPNIHWLARAVATETRSMDVDRNDEATVTLKSLADAVAFHRAALLQLVT
ncbi:MULTISPECIES: hypothetical protein [Paraburkholderia]|uniref:Uncharacterized protein n=1 Tax=Paraburkholderia fungorum TaxID=134537 RepID=A0A420G094_9BURK|nr:MULTISPECIES: hypothetical protein [Paraburkholderia]MBK5119920.1 hypothetical protein [Burkholderia sp. R-69980]MBK5178656.1 hypothetical protein [Burkholderia sp. R-69749]RKF38610.1 hypothetical protein BCY88_34200 [Paraburkholderia fungorum]CAE6781335.1 hypothetical protein R69749_01707 [Paraburkholderia domus]